MYENKKYLYLPPANGSCPDPPPDKRATLFLVSAHYNNNNQNNVKYEILNGD
jgi:hypothetical protein